LEGELVDFVDGSLTFYGMGYKREVTQPDDAAYSEGRDVLFAAGAAMFVRRDIFVDVGGFEERYFVFYEDVDLGWRFNLFGHRVRYVPESASGARTSHLDHVETAFSFRTRILDYFWAGLPVVATEGDALADVIESEALGVTVPPEDVDALADALLRLLDDEDFAAQCRGNIAGVSRRYQWATALRPLATDDHFDKSRAGFTRGFRLGL